MSTRRQFGRIRRLPSGRWQARYPDNARGDVPAPVTFSSKADAARFLARVQTEQERGEWRDPRLGEITFSAWVDEWLAGSPAKRATTRARDESVLNTHFVPTLGAISLGRITPADVRRAVDAMASNLAPTTVRTNLGVVRAVFNAAVDADLIARSPVRGIRRTNGEAKRRPTLTPDELLDLADAIGPRYRVLVLVAGVLGLRWSEAIGLRLGDIDSTAGTITVSQTVAEVAGQVEIAPTKSRASRRTLSVPRFLLDELAAHVQRHGGGSCDDLLFTGPKGGVLRRSFAARRFTPAVAAAGLDPRSPSTAFVTSQRASWSRPASTRGSSSSASATPAPGSAWSSTPTFRRQPIARLQPIWGSGSSRADPRIVRSRRPSPW